MYIDNLYYKNVGPISKLDIKFRKNENGIPVPLVIVGKMVAENLFCCQTLLMHFTN